MRLIKIAVVGVLALLAAVVVAQNTDVVTVRFLAWELSMSGILLLSGTLVLGFLMGFLIAKMPRRAKSA